MSDQPKQPDQELETIVTDEEKCLERVHGHLDNRSKDESGRSVIDYDAELLSLRDQISTARTEDVPPLLEQMERLQALAARRQESTEAYVDPRSPYFGRMVLEEQGRTREVLIGRGTYVDTKSGIRIVDWRDAPVSRLYYRYAEGDDYDEVFGEREVIGEVKVRRSVTITDRELRRIHAPQGNFAKSKKAGWFRLDDASIRLHGGQGSATRDLHRPGKLGVGDVLTDRDDKHLQEITPLIDPRQFELMTKSDSGLVVIQGGAGSGKTTIGLHRLAYLAYQDKRRFRPDKMLIIVFNDALARYISQVLPSLGLHGVPIRTYQDWASRTRATHIPLLPRVYSEDTPSVVTRFKKHPAMLHVIDERVAALAEMTEKELSALAAEDHNAEEALLAWQGTATRPYAHRVHSLRTWLQGPAGELLETKTFRAMQREVERGIRRAQDVVNVWAEMLTDRGLLKEAYGRVAPGAFTDADIERVVTWCTKHCTRAITEMEERQEAGADIVGRRQARERDLPPPSDDDDNNYSEGIDGRVLEEEATLDREDDTLLLRLVQRIRGSLRRGQSAKEALVYEHVLCDEAQDLSPVELAVILGTVSRGQSVTLAGDTAQRLHMDNGFSDWKQVLGDLGLEHVEVEPLKLSYRSTKEILAVSQAVLGPLAPDDPPEATRHGAPVELFQVAQTGDAVAQLAEALRELMQVEARASVAVIARFPEQADLYYQGLKKGEVPYLRRITDQDFPFKPGVDVTDIRQVKGLEFDYVILVETSAASYPENDESRHLMHIGTTRAAHQLWLMCAGKPSLILPAALRDRGY